MSSDTDKSVNISQEQSEASIETTSSVEEDKQVPIVPIVPIVPLTLEEKAFIFNRFYFDLLKKLKNGAKQNKETSKDARNVLRAIKNSYSSYETGSTEYLQKLQTSVPTSFWDEYMSCEVETVDKYLSSDSSKEAWLYNQINLPMTIACCKDAFVLHHYLTIFAILLQDVTNSDVTKALEVMKSFKTKDIPKEIETISNELIIQWITRLHTIYTYQVTNTFSSQFSDMETTSIGRLAKEIMDEVDISTIQNSIGNDGDIFKALSDPNSGIASLLGTVSQKMITKLASGEIKQENLLEDAMKFATKLPGMMGGNTSGALGDLGGIASMMQNLMGGLGQGSKKSNSNSNDSDDEGSGGLDFGSIANMVQGMMGNKAGKSRKMSANNSRAVAASSAAKSMSSNMRRNAMVQKIRNNMEKRKSKENITDQ